MSTKTKIWLIVAVSLLLIGASLFGGALAMSNYDISKIQSKKYETNKYEFEDDFDSISIITDTVEVEIIATDDDSCKVVCYEDIKAKHSVNIVDGVLEIKVNDQRKWYDHINFFIASSPKITLYVPQEEYAELKISTVTGDIKVGESLSFESASVKCSTSNVDFSALVTDKLNVSASTGNVNIKSASLGELDITLSTGDISVSNVTCNEGMKISSSIGDVKLKSCDAASIQISTQTGNVSGSLLSDKVFVVKSSTGKVNVPETTIGGICKITTVTGNVNVKIDN